MITVIDDWSRTERPPPLHRLWQAWSTSFGVHLLLACCLLWMGFDRRGRADGVLAGGGDGPLQLTATFSTELPGGEGEGSDAPSAPAVRSSEPLAVTVEASPDGTPTAPEHATEHTREQPPEQPADTTDQQVADMTTSDRPDSRDDGAAIPLDEPTRSPSHALQVSERRLQAARSLLAAAPPSNRNESPAQWDGASGPGSETGEAGGAGEVAGQSGPRFGRADGASFFQINAQGQHYCYVVDCSNSMADGDAIEWARAELMASIQRLQAKHFQIIFYEAELHRLSDGRQHVLPVSDRNRRLAAHFIRSRQPTGRAIHLPALLAALTSKPDVIFFLTDGEIPEMSARELYEVKSNNRQRTQIHVVEFGHGAKLERNWLDELARQNGGDHRYVDIDAESDSP